MVSYRIGKIVAYLLCPSYYYNYISALSVCPAAFEALKSLNILQLPSRKSLQSFTSVSLRVYQTHCAELEKSTKLKPLGEGLLEVKVQNGVSCMNLNMYTISKCIRFLMQICWHTKTNRIVGLAMTDLVTLGDVYDVYEERMCMRSV